MSIKTIKQDYQTLQLIHKTQRLTLTKLSIKALLVFRPKLDCIDSLLYP